MAEVNPVMVLIARESREMSQSTLAKRAGVQQGTISKIESGHLEPSDELLRSIAEALSYTSGLLCSPIEFRQLPLSFFRKQTRVSQKTAKAIRARVNLIRLHARRMLEKAELPSLRLVQVDPQPGTRDAVRAAQELRLHWHVAPGPIQNLTRLLEANGILVAGCGFSDRRVDAVSIYDPRDGLPPIILIARDLPADRYRFTLAHELGHIVLHYHQQVARDDLDVEEQAHAFAAELLMPEKDIRGHLGKVTLHTLANLKTHWGTSMQALLYRAKELGRISPRNQRYLWMRMGKAGYRKEEPVRLPEEAPSLITELVEVFESETTGGRHAASRELGFVSVDEFEEYYSRPPSGHGPGHLRLVVS